MTALQARVGAAIAMTVALFAPLVGIDDPYDESLFEADLDAIVGIDSAAFAVVVVVAAVGYGSWLVRDRTDPPATSLLVGGAVAATSAGSIALLVRVLTRLTDTGRLLGASGWAWFWMLALGAGLLLSAAFGPLIARRARPVVRLGVFVLPFAGLALTVFAAGFDDNSFSPTPPPVTALVWLAPLVVSGLVRRLDLAVGWVAGVLALHLLGIAVVGADAMACTDDDCVPTPFAAHALLVAALWAAAAWTIATPDRAAA